MHCARCEAPLIDAAATAPRHAWCEVVVCAPCGATNWRCALCCRGTGRHKARLVLSDPASAHDASRWWGKHRVEPAHKRRDAARRERMGRGDIGGDPYDALRAREVALRAVPAAAAQRPPLQRGSCPNRCVLPLFPTCYLLALPLTPLPFFPTLLARAGALLHGAQVRVRPVPGLRAGRARGWCPRARHQAGPR